jgi:LCP family protein required for cell wall assembly
MSNPSPALAAFLSFIFPGAGQLYAGEPRRAVVWALPMLLFIVAVLWLIFGGQRAITDLATAPKLLGILVLNVAFFLYHVAAMIDAYQLAGRNRFSGYRRSGSFAPIALASLVALTMILHGLPAAAWGVPLYNFVAAQQGRPDVLPSFNPRPTPSPSPIPSGATPSPSGQASPTGSGNPTPSGSGPLPSSSPRACAPIDLSGWAMAEDGRVNLLMVGSDSRSDDGVSAASIRTDSMLLLSIDIASCKAAMFSFPRNMQEPKPGSDSRYPTWFRIPLETGGTYPGFLFGLWRDAASTGSNPALYPGSEGVGAECQAQFDCERGWRALTAAIQNMAGVKVDAVVSVNLKGFVDVVNNLPGGGLWIDVPTRLVDTEYFNSQQVKMNIDIEPGCQFMDGELALAYARSRHQDSDYQRARRQQYVIQQVRRQLDPLALLPNIPALLGVAQANLFMTIDDTDIPFLAQVASRIDADRMYRYDFAPARLTRLESMQGMADKVNNIFSEPEPNPTTRPDQEPCPPRP